MEAIDDALIARYAGLSIDVEDSSGTPIPTAVEVFLEEPASEVVTERTYPSVAMLFLGMEFDAEIYQTSDDMPEDIGPLNTLPPVFEQTVREAPLPYRISYSVDTWHKIRVGESRDLVQKAILQRTPPRGFMPVTTVDGNTINAWVLWSGGITQLDEVLPDVVIYHKSLTVEVLAYVLQDTVESQAKVAMEVIWGVSSIKLVTDGLGNTSIDPLGEVLDVVFRITESGDSPV